MYGYDYEEQYFEPSEADLIFQDASEKLKAIVKKEVLDDIAATSDAFNSLKKTCEELKNQNKEKDKQIRELDEKYAREVTKGRVVEAAINNLSKTNALSFLEFAYEKDFDENDRDAPDWFLAIINFYSHRTDVLQFLKACGYDIPSQANNFRLPIDWEENELDVFFDTMSNHYNCNSTTLSGNIGFWYRKRLWSSPNENCKSNYSEIPWQYILRNKRLNKDKYVTKITDAINKGDNGAYFLHVFEYGDLSEENKSTILNGLNPPKRRRDNLLYSTIVKHLQCITNKAILDALYPLICEEYQPPRYFRLMPKEYAIRFLYSCEKDRIPEYLKSLDFLTPDEKKNALTRMIS